MDSVRQDLRYAFRAFGRRRAMTFASIAMLAFGVGATTAIFSILNAVVLKPLPFPEPDRLVAVHSDGRGGLGPLSGPELKVLQERSSSFEQVAGALQVDLNLTGRGRPERLLGAMVSTNVLSLLGLEPSLGRAFVAEDGLVGAELVALISESLWHQRFDGSEAILGGQLALDGEIYTVIGVMPREVAFPDSRVQVWAPLIFEGPVMTSVGSHALEVLGRLKPGTTRDAATSEAASLLASSLTVPPEEHRAHEVGIVALHEEWFGSARPGLLLLLGAVGGVLLITCVNLGNLQLVQAERRRQELALRATLGAGRKRLLRQLLTEHLLLGALGGTVGLLIAAWAKDLLVLLAPGDLPRIETVSLDGTVLAFGVALSLLTGLLLGLLPALEASRVNLREGIQRGLGSIRQSSTRRALITAEVALSLLLLVCAGLLLRSFWTLASVDPGFQPRGVATARVSLPSESYPEPEDMVRISGDLVAELAVQPGVSGAALMNPSPFSGQQARLTLDRADVQDSEIGRLSAMWRAVSPEAFSVLRIPLLRGRLLEPRDDRADAPLVMVLNETGARQIFSGEDPLGKRVILGYNNLEFEIVGIVGDLRMGTLDEAPGLAAYTPFAHTPWPSFSLFARLETDSGAIPAVESLLRGTVSALDPELPVYSAEMLDTSISRSLASRRYVLGLVVGFSLTALLLAALGIFAVVSFSVGRQTREIGIRKALGAGRRDVLGKVLRDGLRPVALGIVVGLVAALLSMGLVRSQLFGVTAQDPVTLTAVALLLIGVSLGATYLPARRAASIDPMTALRHD